MLKPLNSWMGLLESDKHYRLVPTEQYEPLQVYYAEDDNSTEKTIFLFFVFHF